MTEVRLTDEQKTVLGHTALKSFFDLFGENDIRKRVFLEELFRGILSGEYDLSLLTKTGQEGCGVVDDVQRGRTTNEIEGHQSTQSSSPLG